MAGGQGGTDSAKMDREPLSFRIAFTRRLGRSNIDPILTSSALLGVSAGLDYNQPRPKYTPAYRSRSITPNGPGRSALSDTAPAVQCRKPVVKVCYWGTKDDFHFAVRFYD